MNSITKKQRGGRRSTTWTKGIPTPNPKGRTVINPGYSKSQVQRNSKLKKIFGITLEDYNKMLLSQNGVCAICGQPEKNMRSRKNGVEKTLDSLCVDHDHKTGKVRGLLCYRCNTGIGKMNDDPNLLRRAARYIGYILEE